jgi:hypothetical protein
MACIDFINATFIWGISHAENLRGTYRNIEHFETLNPKKHFLALVQQSNSRKAINFLLSVTFQQVAIAAEYYHIKIPGVTPDRIKLGTCSVLFYWRTIVVQSKQCERFRLQAQ